MKLIILIGSFLIFNAFCCEALYVPVYKCTGNQTLCILSGIEVNSTDYDWEPVSDDPWAVRHVQIKTSIIPVITSNICKKFPRITKLEIAGNQVEEVREEAFMGCSQLDYIDLQNNKIKSLGAKTFLHNSGLKNLYLFKNSIADQLDKNIFEKLVNLEYLDLAQNNLTDFSPDVIRHNIMLYEFKIYSNDLLDINVEKIHDLLPDLKRIFLNDNQIMCSRMVEIYNFFTLKGITSPADYGGKVRYYTIQNVTAGSYRCLPDNSWMAAHYNLKNSNTQ